VGHILPRRRSLSRRCWIDPHINVAAMGGEPVILCDMMSCHVIPSDAWQTEYVV